MFKLEDSTDEYVSRCQGGLSVETTAWEGWQVGKEREGKVEG
jgi:hypothetical protein